MASAMWAIQAQVETTDGPWAGSKQVPTFYLAEDVQGITSAGHAEDIGREIILAGWSGDVPPVVHVTAVRL